MGLQGDVGAGRHIPNGPGDQELHAACRDDRPGALVALLPAATAKAAVPPR